MRTNTQEALLSAYIAHTGKRTPRLFSLAALRTWKTQPNLADSQTIWARFSDLGAS